MLLVGHVKLTKSLFNKLGTLELPCLIDGNLNLEASCKDPHLLFRHWANVKADWCCQPESVAQCIIPLSTEIAFYCVDNSCKNKQMISQSCSVCIFYCFSNTWFSKYFVIMSNWMTRAVYPCLIRSRQLWSTQSRNSTLIDYCNVLLCLLKISDILLEGTFAYRMHISFFKRINYDLIPKSWFSIFYV